VIARWSTCEKKAIGKRKAPEGRQAFEIMKGGALGHTSKRSG
jgi:hypothetical protein